MTLHRRSCLARDEIGLNCDGSGDALPLPLGEGWGEGLRSLRWISTPSPGLLAQTDLSPSGRGERSRRTGRFNQKPSRASAQLRTGRRDDVEMTHASYE